MSFVEQKFSKQSNVIEAIGTEEVTVTGIEKLPAKAGYEPTIMVQVKTIDGKVGKIAVRADKHVSLTTGPAFYNATQWKAESKFGAGVSGYFVNVGA